MTSLKAKFIYIYIYISLKDIYTCDLNMCDLLPSLELTATLVILQRIQVVLTGSRSTVQ